MNPAIRRGGAGVMAGVGCGGSVVGIWAASAVPGGLRRPPDISG